MLRMTKNSFFWRLGLSLALLLPFFLKAADGPYGPYDFNVSDSATFKTKINGTLRDGTIRVNLKGYNTADGSQKTWIQAESYYGSKSGFLFYSDGSSGAISGNVFINDHYFPSAKKVVGLTFTTTYSEGSSTVSVSLNPPAPEFNDTLEGPLTKEQLELHGLSQEDAVEFQKKYPDVVFMKKLLLQDGTPFKRFHPKNLDEIGYGD